MMRRVLSPILLPALALAGCGSDPVGHALPPDRFRLTAEVETPEGVKTGSSVVEVQWTTPPKMFGSQAKSGYTIKGEAVAVDLPRGQTLFVLLSSPTSVDWAAHALDGTGLELPQGKRDASVHPVPRTVGLRANEVDNYPYFVRFRDPRDPKTVEQVDPDNLAKRFGPGTKLRALTVQFTTEPVTNGIARRLPWWRQYINRHFDGSSTIAEDMTSENLAAHMSSGRFSTELGR
jgi:hypothetical protein